MRLGNRDRNGEYFRFLTTSFGDIGWCAGCESVGDGGEGLYLAAYMNGVLEDITVGDFVETGIGVLILFLPMLWGQQARSLEGGETGRVQLLLQGLAED